MWNWEENKGRKEEESDETIKIDRKGKEKEYKIWSVVTEMDS